MAAKLIDGKAISAAVKADVAKEVKEFEKTHGFVPGLAVVLVGENPASQVYVRNKKKACEECGILSIEHILPEQTTQKELMDLVRKLNGQADVHGILVQLPLPKGLDENEVLMTIDPAKDVDGFHPTNVGKFLTIKFYKDIMNMDLFLPCTPYGCMELLDRSGVDAEGKNAIVIGRSNIVGKPVAMLLMSKNATVTVCHSRTKNLPDVVKSGDIVVAAIGRAEFVKGEWIKEGAVIIDVGVNRTDAGLKGDVEFEKAKEMASLITPVPGGVGPMTIAMLMKNTLKAARDKVKAKI
ncbi:MAG: bifunctional methylenetetrahydrofolate dehydrogenase/methenyltetrahydrofolate cyclohydrolase FolD [bacterium]